MVWLYGVAPHAIASLADSISTTLYLTGQTFDVVLFTADQLFR